MHLQAPQHSKPYHNTLPLSLHFAKSSAFVNQHKITLHGACNTLPLWDPQYGLLIRNPYHIRHT